MFAIVSTLLKSVLFAAFVVPYAVASLIHQCAPMVSTDLMSSIVTQESEHDGRMWPWAIRDNTADASYYPPYETCNTDTTLQFRMQYCALDIATYLAAQHHVIDIGYAGIDSVHYLRAGMDLAHIRAAIARYMNPCFNLSVGQAVLQDDYRRALLAGYAPGVPAASVALFWYNGAGRSSWDYAQEVIARARTFAVALPMPDEPWPSGAAVVPVALPAGGMAAGQNMGYTGYRPLPSYPRPVQRLQTSSARPAYSSGYEAAVRALHARQMRERLQTNAQIRANLNRLAHPSGT